MRAGGTSDSEFDIARKSFEIHRRKIRAQRRRNVEIRRSVRSAGGGRLIKSGNGEDVRLGAQALKRRENIALPVSEIRTDADKDLVQMCGLSLMAQIRADYQ